MAGDTVALDLHHLGKMELTVSLEAADAGQRLADREAGMMHEPTRVYSDHAGSLATVFVATDDVLAVWSQRVAPNRGLLALSDADLPRALQIIADRRPSLVIVDQLLAASSRGSAFLACLRSNPALSDIEVQVLSADKSAAAAAPGNHQAFASLAGTHVPTELAPLPPVRRAVRLRAPDGMRALVDGQLATIIDLSALGAQVISPSILRPNQRVRLIIDDDEPESIRATAGVMWSAFEKPHRTGDPYFRAGIEFSGMPTDIQRICDRLARGAS